MSLFQCLKERVDLLVVVYRCMTFCEIIALWKKRIISFSSWHLTKSPVEGGGFLGTCRSSPSAVSTVNLCSCQCFKKGILLKHQGTDVL